MLPDRCRLYTTGPGDGAGTWHELDTYTPATSTRFHLHSQGRANSLFGDGRLSAAAPTAAASDTFPSDWRQPVPLVDVGADASTVEARHDVLVYTSDPLEELLTILGPVTAELWLSADVVDCDVVIRLEDVRPDGTAVNMTGEMGCGAFRVRYREGFEREVMMTPGEVVRAEFHVCHSGHTFAAGHRIRVHITGTGDGMLEPNHHTGEPVLTAVDRVPATVTIHHSPGHPSAIILPVLR